MNDKTFKATIESIYPAANKIKIFRINYGEHAFSFKPGQWIDLYAPIEGKNIGGYTIISAPSEKGYFDLAIRESTHHPVTLYLHNTAKAGDEIMITEGQGKFFLSDELMNSPLTLIAGGIGVTPLLSMFRSTDKNKTAVQMFYSVSSEDDILFREELSPFTTFTVTKNHSPKWTGETTRINLEFLKMKNVNFDSHFFICGPKSMIANLTEELKEYGIPNEKIHFEKWW